MELLPEIISNELKQQEENKKNDTNEDKEDQSVTNTYNEVYKLLCQIKKDGANKNNTETLTTKIKSFFNLLQKCVGKVEESEFIKLLSLLKVFTDKSMPMVLSMADLINKTSGTNFLLIGKSDKMYPGIVTYPLEILGAIIDTLYNFYNIYTHLCDKKQEYTTAPHKEAYYTKLSELILLTVESGATIANSAFNLIEVIQSLLQTLDKYKVLGDNLGKFLEENAVAFSTKIIKTGVPLYSLAKHLVKYNTTESRLIKLSNKKLQSGDFGNAYIHLSLVLKYLIPRLRRKMKHHKKYAISSTLNIVAGQVGDVAAKAGDAAETALVAAEWVMSTTDNNFVSVNNTVCWVLRRFKNYNTKDGEWEQLIPKTQDEFAERLIAIATQQNDKLPQLGLDWVSFQKVTEKEATNAKFIIENIFNVRGTYSSQDEKSLKKVKKEIVNYLTY